METGRELIARIAELFTDETTEVHNFEARVVAEHVTGATYTELMTDSFELSEKQVAALEHVVSEHNEGIPLPYVLHSVTFRNLDLYVDQRVLIPRAETELVVQAALDLLHAKNAAHLNVLEIGVGSGAISYSIAQEEPRATVLGCDVSEDALVVARLNSAAVGSAASRVTIAYSDVYSDISHEYAEAYDMIVSNPPYIAQSESGQVEKSVLDYEPHQALFADEDGFSIYRRIIEGASKWLTRDGHIVFEISPERQSLMEEVANTHGFTAEFKKDLQGRIRVGVLSR